MSLHWCIKKNRRILFRVVLFEKFTRHEGIKLSKSREILQIYNMVILAQRTEKVK
jgi:hypothetical protein